MIKLELTSIKIIVGYALTPKYLVNWWVPFLLLKRGGGNAASLRVGYAIIQYTTVDARNNQSILYYFYNMFITCSRPFVKVSWYIWSYIGKLHFYQAKSTLTSQFYIILHAEFDFHGFEPYFIEKTRKIKILKNPKHPSAYLNLRPAYFPYFSSWNQLWRGGNNVNGNMSIIWWT